MFARYGFRRYLAEARIVGHRAGTEVGDIDNENPFTEFSRGEVDAIAKLGKLT